MAEEQKTHTHVLEDGTVVEHSHGEHGHRGRGKGYARGPAGRAPQTSPDHLCRQRRSTDAGRNFFSDADGKTAAAIDAFRSGAGCIFRV